MTEPWFDANHWAWLPGSLFGVMAGLWGALGGTLAARGKGRTLVLGLGWSLLTASAVLFATGMTALYLGQPYGIWYGLALPGLIGLLVIGPLFPVLHTRYRQAEERRMQAEELG